MMQKLTKCFVAGLILFSFSLFAKAQSIEGAAFQKGSNVINLGIGIGTTLFGSGYHGTFPPPTLAYERGIANRRFGIGSYLAHTGAK